MLAIGLDKLCPQASLAGMSFDSPYAAKTLLQGTWRPLWPPGRLLSAFWVLSEASWRPVEVSRRLLGIPSAILESP